MQLNERHYKCIEMMLKGLKYTEIAEKLKCSRQSIYDWLKDDDFVKSLDKCRQEIKTSTNNKVLSKIDTYVEKIEQLADNSPSDTVKLNALTFLYETVMGKATSKVEQTITSNDKDDNSILDLDNIAYNLPIDPAISNNNVINMEEAKKA
jgi:uncharacterized protein YjcR